MELAALQEDAPIQQIPSADINNHPLTTNSISRLSCDLRSKSWNPELGPCWVAQCGYVASDMWIHCLLRGKTLGNRKNTPHMYFCWYYADGSASMLHNGAVRGSRCHCCSHKATSSSRCYPTTTWIPSHFLSSFFTFTSCVFLGASAPAAETHSRMWDRGKVHNGVH